MCGIVGYAGKTNVIKNINGDSTGDRCLIVDSKNVFEGTLENLKKMYLGYEF